MDPSYGGGYTKPAIETADASPSSPSSPTNKKETGEKKSSGKDEMGTKKSSGKDETGTTVNGDNGQPVKKLSTVDYLPPNATTPTPAKKEHSDASGKDEKAADVGHKEKAMRPMRPDKQANAAQPAKAQANAEQPAKAQAKRRLADDKKPEPHPKRSPSPNPTTTSPTSRLRWTRSSGSCGTRSSRTSPGPRASPAALVARFSRRLTKNHR